MKRTVFSVLVVLPLAIYGCSSDDGDGNGTGGSGATGGTGGTGGAGGNGAAAGSGGTGGSGGVFAECDPLQQDCDGGDACYVILQTGEQVCESVSTAGIQDEPCTFVNDCDVGYGCNLLANENTSDRVCAFFCDPDGGSPSCAADGPGPSYVCQRINGFWGDVPNVSLTLGMCLDPLVFPDL